MNLKRLRLIIGKSYRAGGAVGRILVGTLIGQGAVILVTPLLTRQYSAGDFGLLALITAFAAVLGGFATLSFESAVPIAASQREAAALLVLAVGSTLMISACTAVVMFALRVELGAWLSSALVVDYWWLVPVTVMMIGLFNAVSACAVRLQQYRVLAYRNAFQGLAQAGWAVVLGWIWPASGLGLASSLAVGRLSGAAAAGYRPLAEAWTILRTDRKAVKDAAILFRRFPLILSWSRLVNGSGLQIPIVLIAICFGSVELGLYALTIRLLSAPVGMITDAVSQYFEGEFASRLRGQLGLTSLIVRISASMFVAALLPAVVVLAFGPDIYAFVFGEPWREAGEYARVIVFVTIMQLAVAPVSRALVLLERQFAQLLWDCGRLALVVAAILIPALGGSDLFFTLVWMTAAQCFSYLVMFMLVLAAAIRRSKTYDPN